MKNGLRSVLESARAEFGGSMSDYTVLSAGNDPYRIDTPGMHEAGKWLAAQMEKHNLFKRNLHLRDLHYALNGIATKPDGSPYINNDQNWS